MKIFGMVTTKASWEYTSYAVKSFFRNTKLDEEDRLYLIDNDFGFEEEASWFSPGLQILKNEKPMGFSANMNQVLRLAKEKACDFYILHNDISVVKCKREIFKSIRCLSNIIDQKTR